ncbi:MAG: hypothetical protein C4340_06415 [Armatimonadota bacterium]
MKGTVILGVTGSIAAYRAADVARELMRAGFEVRACLSRAALQFVTPALFENLTGNPCRNAAAWRTLTGRAKRACSSFAPQRRMRSRTSPKARGWTCSRPSHSHPMRLSSSARR